MIVDVVRMRADGKKLSTEQLRNAAPLRGRLSLRTSPWRESWAPNLPMQLTTFASLFESLDDDPLAEPFMQLREAHVNRLAGDNFVIVGIERTGAELRERDEPQAWWCRRAAGSV